MKDNGVSANDIERINQKSNIYNYGTADVCINKVFHEFWMRNPQELSMIDYWMRKLSDGHQQGNSQ